MEKIDLQLLGGRGAYFSGASRDMYTREYDGVGFFEGVKMVESRGLETASKSTLPMYSNGSDAYILVDNGRIRKIGFYEDGHIARSIDVDDPKGVHAHNWEMVLKPDYETPIMKPQKQHLALTDEEKSFVERLTGRTDYYVDTKEKKRK